MSGTQIIFFRSGASRSRGYDIVRKLFPSSRNQEKHSHTPFPLFTEYSYSVHGYACPACYDISEEKPCRVSERKKKMKKILSLVICLCLIGSASASAEEMDPGSFLLRIRDRSGLEISYLRFDLYIGEDQYAGLVCSTPDEGEDFYRFPYEAGSPEALKNLRIECSYGKSDLSPEDAILQVMMGNVQEEHALLTLDFVPEGGQIYDLSLVPDEKGGWMLIPYEPVLE